MVMQAVAVTALVMALQSVMERRRCGDRRAAETSGYDGKADGKLRVVPDRHLGVVHTPKHGVVHSCFQVARLHKHDGLANNRRQRDTHTRRSRYGDTLNRRRGVSLVLLVVPGMLGGNCVGVDG